MSILFTSQADSALNDIIKKFNLEEKPEDFIKKIKENKDTNIVAIDKLIRSFADKTISENNLISQLQKTLEVPLQTAQDISEEIISKIIPLLGKASEEKSKDSGSADDLSKKSWDNDPANFTDIIEKKKSERPIIPPKKQPKARITAVIEDVKKMPSKPNQPKGPDKYREPVE